MGCIRTVPTVADGDFRIGTGPVPNSGSGLQEALRKVQSCIAHIEG